jgi:hypothetical protein
MIWCDFYKFSDVLVFCRAGPVRSHGLFISLKFLDSSQFSTWCLLLLFYMLIFFIYTDLDSSQFSTWLVVQNIYWFFDLLYCWSYLYISKTATNYCNHCELLFSFDFVVQIWHGSPGDVASVLLWVNARGRWNDGAVSGGFFCGVHVKTCRIIELVLSIC